MALAPGAGRPLSRVPRRAPVHHGLQPRDLITSQGLHFKYHHAGDLAACDPGGRRRPVWSAARVSEGQRCLTCLLPPSCPPGSHSCSPRVGLMVPDVPAHLTADPLPRKLCAQIVEPSLLKPLETRLGHLEGPAWGSRCGCGARPATPGSPANCWVSTCFSPDSCWGFC